MEGHDHGPSIIKGHDKNYPALRAWHVPPTFKLVPAPKGTKRKGRPWEYGKATRKGECRGRGGDEMCDPLDFIKC